MQQRRRLARMRFLGELYSYEHIDSSVIFETLHLIIVFGHGTPEVSKHLSRVGVKLTSAVFLLSSYLLYWSCNNPLSYRVNIKWSRAVEMHHVKRVVLGGPTLVLPLPLFSTLLLPGCEFQGKRKKDLDVVGSEFSTFSPAIWINELLKMLGVST